MIKNERVKLGAFCEGPAGLTKDLVSPQGTFLWIQKTQGLLQKASRWGVGIPSRGSLLLQKLEKTTNNNKFNFCFVLDSAF